MKRLITLDMLRGYALVSIMVNHMPLSVMRSVTLPNFSIFDASELFVLLSGFLVGMVWRSVEAKEGRRTAQHRFARRSFEVWRAMILGALGHGRAFRRCFGRRGGRIPRSGTNTPCGLSKTRCSILRAWDRCGCSPTSSTSWRSMWC